MTIKRVALITPPYHSGVVESAGTWLNVGLVYIAGALRAQGYEVDYYDAMSLWHKWPEIQERIEAFNPDVVATTAYTASIVHAVELVRLAKSVNPQVVTVIGNVHATFCYEELLSADHNVIDYVVRGEGEVTLPSLLNCLNAGEDPAAVPGLAFYSGGSVIATPKAPYIQDLDSLQAAWDLVEWPIYTYRAKNNARLAIVSSSRGCQQKCSFCSQQLFWAQTWRARSPENFIAELEMLNNKYGVEVAMLSDEIPTFDRDRWVRILDLMIERKVGVKLLMETRVDDILRDADIMDKYRKAGVEHIYVGVEAGSQETLDLFKKDTKVEQSKLAIDIINNADIVSETSFVLGMPEDTPESIAATIELAKHYNPDMAFFLAIAPWPYAELYPQLEKYVVTKDYRKYNLVEPVLKPINMSVDELEKELGKAAQKFYMHKFQNLDKIRGWKKDFMLAVLDIFINHSYLAGQIKAAMKEGKEMPPEVKALIKTVKGHKSPAMHQAIAPIP
ncbi:anaerobic magnesium-protoporphyrin IX monomethyl ester oxidative cyclase-related enzyme [Geotalea daltonii FRC-32]|uniref:Anaerobic magnesium-protoporphyrin IX monomethyl ester oxidative cyclase-related enzyme n=1 Tax=Geotalea daltonii (strain DSM 22248 / JCM 15807 / FRC-32) TaxID=316067 RepID=B9M4Z8_GEODF|nr:cobalamin-dependent protein [Geotalea daltonii]ACM21682.1 anaerobic magnesium-protoporphyrin IX monomethyl ester oxidative cyclase-related enzyme [Geotalea daltonii FRC-32]